MAEPNLQEISDYLLALAGRAGELMVSAKPSIDTMGTKKNCRLIRQDVGVGLMQEVSCGSGYRNGSSCGRYGVELAEEQVS